MVRGNAHLGGAVKVAATSPGAVATCAHCGDVVSTGPHVAPAFCCPGCAAAYEVVQGLGLDAYYRQRNLDENARRLKPDALEDQSDVSAFVQPEGDGWRLHLMVEGLHCPACVWLIESVLAKEPEVSEARVNLSTKRLSLAWRGQAARARRLVGAVTKLGYRLVPFDPALLRQAEQTEDRTLLRALAVAGFAAANVMLLSVAVWAGAFQDMGPATRDLLHWISALIALPAIVFAGRPFFSSALAGLKSRRLNMDVPISLAVTAAAGMSLYETMQSGAHVYFDSACALLFFLLIGRYLDRRARARAYGAAQHLLGLSAQAVTVVDEAGMTRTLNPKHVTPGMTVLAAAGERIAVDGRVTEGFSEIDTSLITGEALPRRAGPGELLHAGMLNIAAPIRLVVEAAGQGTLLAEIVRIMETAEASRARYVTLADRVARLYAPLVHVLAALTFAGWYFLGGAAWQEALLIAIAVMVITCPCALGLAVPMVQVVASGRLLRRGILLKSGDALERLAQIDTVVFDKTGTLTAGKPRLVMTDIDRGQLALAASLAGASRHVLARALVAAAAPASVAAGVTEVPGAGLEAMIDGKRVRLGNRRWCGVDEDGAADQPELWLASEGAAPSCFTFEDPVREDAGAVIYALRQNGLRIALLSGDRAPSVAATAALLGIDDWRADCRPEEKARHLRTLADAGNHVLMVGDGLNDAPALASAFVSMSPSSAADISQTAADIVFQGERLGSVVESLAVAHSSRRLVRQNFALAFAYNLITVPLAVAGIVTPLIAAIAMSGSSLLVVANALRLGREKRA